MESLNKAEGGILVTPKYHRLFADAIADIKERFNYLELSELAEVEMG